MTLTPQEVLSGIAVIWAFASVACVLVVIAIAKGGSR